LQPIPVIDRYRDYWDPTHQVRPTTFVYKRTWCKMV